MVRCTDDEHIETPPHGISLLATVRRAAGRARETEAASVCGLLRFGREGDGSVVRDRDVRVRMRHYVRE